MEKRVSDDTLEKYVNQTFHWNALPPHQSHSIAKELLKLRKFVRQLEGLLITINTDKSGVLDE